MVNPSSPRQAGSVAVFALLMVACTVTIVIAGITLTGSSRTKQTRLEQQRIAQNAFDGGVDYCVDLAQAGSLTLPQTVSLTVGSVSDSLVVTDNSASIASTVLVSGTLTYNSQSFRFSKVIGNNANPTYNFTYTSSDGNTANGQIVCKSNGGGSYTAISGWLTITASSNAAVVGSGYTLWFNASGTGARGSPSGRFNFDNQFYPSAVSQMNVNGLLFIKSGVEINVWGNGGANNYSFYAAVPSGYNPASDNKGTFISQLQ